MLYKNHRHHVDADRGPQRHRHHHHCSFWISFCDRDEYLPLFSSCGSSCCCCYCCCCCCSCPSQKNSGACHCKTADPARNPAANQMSTMPFLLLIPLELMTLMGEAGRTAPPTLLLLPLACDCFRFCDIV